MKKIILFSIGLIPFVLGILMNSWMMKNPNSVLPFKLIGIIFLVCWLLVGFITCKFDKTPLKSAVIIHLPAFLVLVLIMFQNIILGHYWSNLFGWAVQMYYLLLINISNSLVRIVLFFNATHVWMMCLMSFILMFGSYYLGSKLKKSSAKSALYFN